MLHKIEFYHESSCQSARYHHFTYNHSCQLIEECVVALLWISSTFIVIVCVAFSNSADLNTFVLCIEIFSPRPVASKSK